MRCAYGVAGFLLLAGCDGLGVGGSADVPSPMVGAFGCVEALSDQVGQNRRVITVLNTETTARGSTTEMSVLGGDPWTCQMTPEGQITTLAQAG